MTPIPAPHAYVVLFLWPLVMLALFRYLPLRPALIWSIVGAYLFLPAANVVYVDVPALPQIDKVLLPAAMLLVIAPFLVNRYERERMISARRGDSVQPPPLFVLPGFLPHSVLGLALLGGMILSVFLTVLTNGDVRVYGSTTLPEMRLYDGFAASLNALVIILTLLMGRKFLADPKAHRALLEILCIAAVIYAVLALYEIRMSPQLNRMVYGFFPHDWAQHVRGGGFRPLVFLNHGLLLGIFFASAILATATMYRISKKGSKKFRYLAALVFLLAVLVLSKTLGALFIALLLLPVALFLPVRMQLIAAAVIAGLTLTYPLVRGAGLVPTEQILSIVSNLDEERARSLGFRFYHEDALLDKANERPLFGWGGWSRWRVYDERGEDITVSDGEWIIIVSQWGWLGYISRLGFLCFPLILFTLRQKRYDVDLATSGLCLVIAANLVDLIPNASPSPIIWLAAGALLGRLESPRGAIAMASEAAAATEMATKQTSRPPQRHTRFPTNKSRGRAVQ